MTPLETLHDVASLIRMRASLGEVMELTPADLALRSLATASAIVAARHRIDLYALNTQHGLTCLDFFRELERLPAGEFRDEILRPWNYGGGR